MFADVTSANVVGYMNVARPAATQPNICSGSMFTNIGEDGITLADIKITGHGATAKACRLSYIQFLMTGGSTKLDANKKYWVDENGKWRRNTGTNNPANDPEVTDAEKAEIVINPGEGFLCYLNSNAATITYSGEVVKGLEKKISIQRPASTQPNVIISNPSGETIDLTKISFSGHGTTAKACRLTYIQFFATGGSTKLDADKKYWVDENGKWRRNTGTNNPANDPELSDTEKAEVTIAPGMGFLCYFNTNGATLVLPTSL